MHPYSHLVIASKLEALVKPEVVQEYYWGSIAPDIRYVAALPRQQTHLAPARIVAFISQYPALRSFLQGYLVHCLCDEMELRQVFLQHFPFSVFKNELSYQQIAAILELYYFENSKVHLHISGRYNEFLHGLGVSETVASMFSRSVSQYALSSSPASNLPDIFHLMGLENDSQINQYVNAAQSFQKNWLVKNSLFLGIRAGRISGQIVSMAASLYQQCYGTGK